MKIQPQRYIVLGKPLSDTIRDQCLHQHQHGLLKRGKLAIYTPSTAILQHVTPTGKISKPKKRSSLIKNAKNGPSVALVSPYADREKILKGLQFAAENANSGEHISVGYLYPSNVCGACIAIKLSIQDAARTEEGRTKKLTAEARICSTEMLTTLPYQLRFKIDQDQNWSRKIYSLGLEWFGVGKNTPDKTIHDVFEIPGTGKRKKHSILQKGA